MKQLILTSFIILIAAAWIQPSELLALSSKISDLSCGPINLGQEIFNKAEALASVSDMKLDGSLGTDFTSPLQIKLQQVNMLIDALDPNDKEQLEFFLRRLSFSSVRIEVEAAIKAKKSKDSIKVVVKRELSKAMHLYKEMDPVTDELLQRMSGPTPLSMSLSQKESLRKFQESYLQKGVSKELLNEILYKSLTEKVRHNAIRFGQKWHAENKNATWSQFKQSIAKEFSSFPFLTSDEDFLLTIHLQQAWPNIQTMLTAAAPPDDLYREMIERIKNGESREAVHSILTQKMALLDSALRESEETLKLFFRTHGDQLNENPEMQKLLASKSLELLTKYSKMGASPTFLATINQRLKDTRFELVFESFTTWIKAHPEAQFEEFRKSSIAKNLLSSDQAESESKLMTIFYSHIFMPSIVEIFNHAKATGYELESPGNLEVRIEARKKLDHLYLTLEKLVRAHPGIIDIQMIRQHEKKIRERAYFKKAFSVDSEEKISLKPWRDIQKSGILKHFPSEIVERASVEIRINDVIEPLHLAAKTMYANVRDKSQVNNAFSEKTFQFFSREAQNNLRARWANAKHRLKAIQSDHPELVLRPEHYEKLFNSRIKELEDQFLIEARQWPEKLQKDREVRLQLGKISEAARFQNQLEKNKIKALEHQSHLSDHFFRDSSSDINLKLPSSVTQAKDESQFLEALSKFSSLPLESTARQLKNAKANHWIRSVSTDFSWPWKISVQKLVELGITDRQAGALIIQDLSNAALDSQRQSRLNQIERSEESTYTLKRSKEEIALKEEQIKLEKLIAEISGELKVPFNWRKFKESKYAIRTSTKLALDNWLAENPPPDDTWSNAGRRISGELVFNSINYPHVIRSLWNPDGYLSSRETLIDRLNTFFSTDGRLSIPEGIDSQNFMRDYAVRNPLFSAGSMIGHLCEGVPLVAQTSAAGYASIADSILCKSLSTVTPKDLKELENSEDISGTLATAGRYSQNAGLFFLGFAATAGLGGAPLTTVSLDGLTLGQQARALSQLAIPLGSLLVSKPIRAGIYLGGSSAVGQELYRIGTIEELYKQESELIDANKAGAIVKAPDLELSTSLWNIIGSTTEGTVASQTFMGTTSIIRDSIRRLTALSYLRLLQDGNSKFSTLKAGLRVGQKHGIKTSAFIDFAEGMSEFPDTLKMFDTSDLTSTMNMGALVLFASNAYDTIDMTWANSAYSKVKATSEKLSARFESLKKDRPPETIFTFESLTQTPGESTP